MTPGGGTLTIGSRGQLNLSPSMPSTTTLSINGNVNNFGSLTTGTAGPPGSADTVNVSGAFTNSGGLSLAGASDVMDVATLSNSGSIYINPGSTLNLTNQPNGITDIVKNSGISVGGSFTAGSASALANLTSIEGRLGLENGQTTSVTPGGGTLTISSTGQLGLSSGTESGTTLSVTAT